MTNAALDGMRVQMAGMTSHVARSLAHMRTHRDEVLSLLQQERTSGTLPCPTSQQSGARGSRSATEIRNSRIARNEQLEGPVLSQRQVNEIGEYGGPTGISVRSNTTLALYPPHCPVPVLALHHIFFF
jgi:hypothetical protein